MAGSEQSFFQVRLDWGAAGLRRLAPAEVVVLVDVLGLSARAAASVAGIGSGVPADAAERRAAQSEAPAGLAVAGREAAARCGAAAAVLADAAASGALVLAGGLRNARAVAGAILGEQGRRGDRVGVAVIPVGAAVEAGGGTAAAPASAPADAAAPATTAANGAARGCCATRFRVEDQLAAGAIVAALGDVGIDHTSPEAALAAEAFRALRGGVRHLVAASVRGQELAAAGRGQEIAEAAGVDTSDAVPVLRAGRFVRFDQASR